MTWTCGSNKLTVLVGAGGSIELGMPGTFDATNDLIAVDPNETNDPFLRDDKEILRGVYQAINGYYAAPNFEHMLHALEAISSLELSWRGAAEKFRVVYGRFSAPRADVHNLFDRQLLHHATQHLIKRLHYLFLNPSNSAKSNRNWALYEGFWRKLFSKFSLDVATTNYDTLIEQSLPSLEQGFRPVDGEETLRFAPRQLGQAKNRLIHLHGSLHFGYRTGVTSEEVNRFVYEDESEDLYWHRDPADAVQTWGVRSNSVSQAGEETVVGGLITGMQKANKLLVAEPYLTYQRIFGQMAQDNPRLLVIGYGFGDHHLNQLVSRMTRWHGKDRRVALITWCPEKEWFRRHHSHENLNEIMCVERWSEENEPWLDGMMNYAPVWTSKNGLVRIYTVGLLNTAREYLDDLISFLH